MVVGVPKGQDFIQLMCICSQTFLSGVGSTAVSKAMKTTTIGADVMAPANMATAQVSDPLALRHSGLQGYTEHT